MYYNLGFRVQNRWNEDDAKHSIFYFDSKAKRHFFCRNMVNGPNNIYLSNYLDQIGFLSAFLDLKVMYYM